MNPSKNEFALTYIPHRIRQKIGITDQTILNF